ncbi:glutamate--cysteine ligase [Suhomyces tanzawaensis NRRL Y-17324]|uniref:Glutamate--cysteine ligase n=1 Tax=Suhomyces tanzawaensis NRRL Y-17324 TaxID=984487 RepID=A0A1E4SDH5_9ASCO|nr:glutamate--cysteine ligase [Suhomyces tanzawaensis NRRL Y-17324]ODV77533.1 glutamate--cysteine ligase [Suhomyces tanzawaensis NRRL Y-17324]
MGLLSLGTPLDWHDSRHHNEHVREHGIIQLINMFKQHAGRTQDTFLWGDEVEYMLVDIDEAEKTAKLSIDKDHILKSLNDESLSLHKSVDNNISFHPEYGRYMLEGTPASPYNGNSLDDYVYVEKNMIKRREVSESELPAHIKPLTLTTFPRMGCPNFTSPCAKPIGPASQSLFLPDEIINRHVRFPTLTANIRKRRGCKVAINLPIYPDINTKLLDDSIPHNRDLFDSDKEPFIGASKPGHVYMDSMGFGMGSSCLQITMQAANIDEARYLYDTLAPITPIMLSLSAAAPIFKGFLVNQDVRWNVVSGAVDDRTFVERNSEPYAGYNVFGGLNIGKDQLLSSVDVNQTLNEYGDLKNLKTDDGKPIQRVPKSRYDSIDNYLGDGSYSTSYFNPKLNDIQAPINKKVFDKLHNEHPELFDTYLANHFAHLFVRDPLVLFSERINQDDELENDHFENIQSTNWQTLRFKPPALYENGTDLSTKPGWRVEFRPMEIQLTDFENAAYSNFISLLSKAIIKFRPNLYIPISKIERNMKTAHNVDSVLEDKFWFKSLDQWNLNNNDFIGYDLSWFDRYLNAGNDELGHDEVYINGYSRNGAIINQENGNRSSAKTVESINEVDDEGTDQKYTINEIINGNDKFPGLIRLIIRVIANDLLPAQQSHHCESQVLAKNLIRIKHYLLLISQRASGKIPTTANWIRAMVLNHESYERDSKVGVRVNYDLVQSAVEITDLLNRELVLSFFGETVGEYLLGSL